MHREIETPDSSRQWFTKDDISTDAFKEIVKNSISDVAKDLQVIIADKLAENENFTASASDLCQMLPKKHNPKDVAKAMRELNFSPKMMRYIDYWGTSKNGLVYQFCEYNNENLPF